MSDRKQLKERLREFNADMNFTLKFSCPMNWEEMEEVGDRCRHCAKCELPVYDLVGLDAADIDELLAANDGEICGQAYIRNDNRLSFDECKYPRRILRGKVKPSFPNG